MKKSGLMAVILVCLVNALCLTANAGEIRIGAGAAPTENILKPVREPFEKATGIRLSIISSGPKNALLDLEKGEVDAAAAGLSFDDWMALMKKEAIEVKEASSFQQVIIGKDKIVVLVHKDNPVSKLSKEQLKGIFTGKISNWKDVGGKDMPIVVVWGKLIPGTNSMFLKNMLDGESETKDVLDATTAEDVRQNVSSNREAIGIGPLAVINETIKSPETPEIARPITLLTKGKPSASVQKLIDYIKGEGRQYTK